MNTAGRHKRTWVWVAIVALLSNVLALVAPTTAASVDEVLGPLVICTSDGAKPLHGISTERE